MSVFYPAFKSLMGFTYAILRNLPVVAKWFVLNYNCKRFTVSKLLHWLKIQTIQLL